MTEDEVVRRLPAFARGRRFEVGTRVVVSADRSSWGQRGRAGAGVDRSIDHIVIKFDDEAIPLTANLIWVTDLREPDVIEELARLA